MTNKPKRIGTAAEMAVVRHLEALKLDAIYRPALQGINDLGDIHYRTPSRKIVVSVKGGKMAETASPERIVEWLAEVEAQRARAQGQAAFVVTKRAGVGAPRAGLWRAHVKLHGACWTTDLDTMILSSFLGWFPA